MVSKGFRRGFEGVKARSEGVEGVEGVFNYALCITLSVFLS